VETFMASDKYILAKLYTHWNKCWLGITSRAFSVHFQHYSKKLWTNWKKLQITGKPLSLTQITETKLEKLESALDAW